MGRPRIPAHLRAYRPRLSAELERTVKAAAGLAGLSVDDYWQQVALPLLQDDLARRLATLNWHADATFTPDPDGDTDAR